MGQVKRLHLNAVTKSIADPGHLLAGQIHVEDQPCQAGWRVTQPTAKGVHHALQSGTQGGDKFASRPYYEQGWIRFEESSLLPIRNTTGIGLESFAHSIYPSVCDPKSFSFTHGRGNADSNGGLNSRVVNGHLATRGNRRNVSLYLSPRYIHARTHVCTYIHIIFSFLEDLFGCVKETLQFSCQRFASIAVSFISGCLTHCYQYTAGKCSVCEMSAKKPKIWPRVGDTVPVFRAGVIKSQQTNVEFLKWVYLLEKWYTYIYVSLVDSITRWIGIRENLSDRFHSLVVRVVYGCSCMCNASVIHPLYIISREHATVMRKQPMFLVRGEFETSIWISSKITHRRGYEKDVRSSF